MVISTMPETTINLILKGSDITKKTSLNERLSERGQKQTVLIILPISRSTLEPNYQALRDAPEII